MPLSTKTNMVCRRIARRLVDNPAQPLLAGLPMTPPAMVQFATPAAVVDEYLRLLMIPDPQAARRFVAPDLRIRFTGGREMRDPAECAAFNALRYRW